MEHRAKRTAMTWNCYRKNHFFWLGDNWDTLYTVGVERMGPAQIYVVWWLIISDHQWNLFN